METAIDAAGGGVGDLVVVSGGTTWSIGIGSVTGGAGAGSDISI